MKATWEEKQRSLQKIFSNCKTKEDTYLKVIELGKSANALSDKWKTSENIVSGCQSIVYLRSFMEDGLIFFEAESEALISSGLAVLLTSVYSGETPETVLKCPPDYLDRLKISTSLTPSRANGLYSIHLRMKQDALNFLIQR